MVSSFVRTWPLLGTVAAGWPSPAEEELIDRISFDEWLIEDSTFLIRVGTDAMQDAGILTGDIVVFRRGQKPKSGDVVVAQVDNEWLIRYYTQEKGTVTLYPANGNYSPVTPDEVRVVGVIRSVIRKY